VKLTARFLSVTGVWLVLAGMIAPVFRHDELWQLVVAGGLAVAGVILIAGGTWWLRWLQ
jgi:hypothetical protein